MSFCEKLPPLERLVGFEKLQPLISRGLRNYNRSSVGFEKLPPLEILVGFEKLPPLEVWGLRNYHHLRYRLGLRNYRRLRFGV
jgi:hypothetical protein